MPTKLPETICEVCEDTGWVCERHPDHCWDGKCCGGAGTPCRWCNPSYGLNDPPFLPFKPDEIIRE